MIAEATCNICGGAFSTEDDPPMIFQGSVAHRSCVAGHLKEECLKEGRLQESDLEGMTDDHAMCLDGPWAAIFKAPSGQMVAVARRNRKDLESELTKNHPDDKFTVLAPKGVSVKVHRIIRLEV